MIRNVCVCPYCGDVAAGVDDDGPALVLAPDRADDRPCPHLAFVCVSLDAYELSRGNRVPHRTGHWLWVRGQGPQALPRGPADSLSDYVDQVALELLAGESLPSVEYQVTGGTAGLREDDRAGTGEFPIQSAGGPALAAILDGHGLFSRTPDALVAEVRRLAAL